MKTYKDLIIILLSSIILLSCNKQINIFKTGYVMNKDFKDTFFYDKRDKFVIIPSKVDDESYNFMFDTGADLLIFHDKSKTTQKIKCQLKDSNGKINIINVLPINNFKVSDINLKGLYGFNMKLPTPFLSFCDGVIGNNIIKAFNWSIEENEIVLSDAPIYASDEKLKLNIFYIGSNRLCSNIIINKLAIDTTYFDFGDSSGEILLSKRAFNTIKAQLKPNKFYNVVSTSYGANGISKPDTILRVNANIEFNGIKMDSVNIDVNNVNENRIGLTFLKRFGKIIINNSENNMLFGSLDDKYNYGQHEIPVQFDFVDGDFIIKWKIIKPETDNIYVGEKFIEINSAKSNDIKDYTEFLKFADQLKDKAFLELKTCDNKTIKIHMNDE